jgi:N-acylneuraminate cytidylyltransferase
MKKIGFIPLRKGSKGIKNKNKKKMVGRPLFSWVLKEAIFSDLDLVYIYTDDDDIIEFVQNEYHWTQKVKVMRRSDESASDVASTEMGMIEFCQKIDFDFDVLCLLQATSPLTTSIDINLTIDKVLKEKFDAALTVVKTHRFIWDKSGKPINYDFYNRPRRQDFDGLLIENGAVYATTKAAFQQSNNRLSGSIGIVEMAEESLMEIDSLSDWNIVEGLLVNRQKSFKKSERITHLVLDVDGVFTDGCVWFDANGELAKKFDMRDGMGLEILRQNQVEVITMTSENSTLVEARMKKLKINQAYFGIKDKFAFLTKLVLDKNISFNNIAYVGDDVNDLANICSVGWSFSPNNATESVKQHSDIKLAQDSANGAIRATTEFIINYNKRYE